MYVCVCTHRVQVHVQVETVSRFQVSSLLSPPFFIEAVYHQVRRLRPEAPEIPLFSLPYPQDLLCPAF